MSETSQEISSEEVKDRPMMKGGADEKVLRMGTGSIPKLILEFAIPSICGMLVNGAYNLISSIFLGQAMGEIGLAVATAANPTMVIFMGLSMLVGLGGNALCALRLGEGRKDLAEKTLGNTVTLSFILWALILFLAFCPITVDFLLTLSSATDDIRPYAKTFVQILSLGFVFQCAVKTATAGKTEHLLLPLQLLGAGGLVFFPGISGFKPLGGGGLPAGGGGGNFLLGFGQLPLFCAKFLILGGEGIGSFCPHQQGRLPLRPGCAAGELFQLLL